MSNLLEVTPAAIPTEGRIPSQTPPADFASNSNSSSKGIGLDDPTQETSARAVVANKKVTGLWRACGVDRNAWMSLDGIGWRKFADNSDSAIMAYTIIAAHAKTTGKEVNYYEGDDGKVNTLYVL